TDGSRPWSLLGIPWTLDRRTTPSRRCHGAFERQRCLSAYAGPDPRRPPRKHTAGRSGSDAASRGGGTHVGRTRRPYEHVGGPRVFGFNGVRPRRLSRVYGLYRTEFELVPTCKRDMEYRVCAQRTWL